MKPGHAITDQRGRVGIKTKPWGNDDSLVIGIHLSSGGYSQMTSPWLPDEDAGAKLGHKITGRE